MSETLGLTVLRKVAEHYRANPASWCVRSGNLFDVAQKNPEEVLAALKDPCKEGCIDTLIVCYSIVVGSDQTRGVAEADAIRTLCEHHGLKFDKESIFNFNDAEDRTVTEIIAFVEAPFTGTPKYKSSAGLPVPVELVVAAFALMLFLAAMFGNPAA